VNPLGKPTEGATTLADYQNHNQATETPVRSNCVRDRNYRLPYQPFE